MQGQQKYVPRNSPDTLRQLCSTYCANHLDATLCCYDNNTSLYQLRDNVILPSSECQNLLQAYLSEGKKINDKFLHIYKDTMNTRLQTIDLSNSAVTDLGLEWLCSHPLVELNISNCKDLTSNIIHIINHCGASLQALRVGDSSHIFSSDEFKDEIREANIENYTEGYPVYGQDYIFNTPNLKLFSLHNLKGDDTHDLIATLLSPFTKLSYLDLSGCNIAVQFMDCLEEVLSGSLKSLILHNVTLSYFHETVLVIGKMKELRQLDISMGPDTIYDYPQPEMDVQCLVHSLPKLISLDISFTNLAGTGVEVIHEPGEKGDNKNTCIIPGLQGRQFEFLGLLGCRDDACSREGIPAAKVAGDANEEQVLCSLQSYVDKPDLLLSALGCVFHLFRHSKVVEQREVMQAILTAMQKYPDDKNIQISGSASMFYIVKEEGKLDFDTKVKKQIVRCILDAMEEHDDETTMLRNACLTLYHLHMSQDVIFEYQRLVHILLHIVDLENPEEFVQRIAIYLLNSLACQVDSSEKQVVGELNGISTMLKLIRKKLQAKECDEVMEIAWSTMWNVTDETPINCERFMNQNGMQLFLDCLDIFPEKDELLRNMMGLMGNVAEVKELRPKLMQSQFVTVFSQLLESTSDGIEVSYNAAGVLSHMACDGLKAWTIDTPAREVVLQSLATAIERWDLNTKRNINYRSFMPLLKLVACYGESEAQHWAIWALCNLTRVYPDKYCPLLQCEKGIELLRELLNHPIPNAKIKELALIVVEEYRAYERRKENSADIDEDEMDITGIVE